MWSALRSYALDTTRALEMSRTCNRSFSATNLVRRSRTAILFMVRATANRSWLWLLYGAAHRHKPYVVLDSTESTNQARYTPWCVVSSTATTSNHPKGLQCFYLLHTNVFVEVYVHSYAADIESTHMVTSSIQQSGSYSMNKRFRCSFWRDLSSWSYVASNGLNHSLFVVVMTDLTNCRFWQRTTSKYNVITISPDIHKLVYIQSSILPRHKDHVFKKKGTHLFNFLHTR